MEIIKDSRRLVLISATPLLILLIFALFYATLFEYSNTANITIWKQYLSNWAACHRNRKVIDVVEDHKSLKFLFERLVRGGDRSRLESIGFACNSAPHSEVCVANKPVRIDTQTMTVHIPSNQTMPSGNHVVWPYARKDDKNAMNNVSPVQIIQNNNTQPPCDHTYNVPAVIFSSGGFVGNYFHEFNDVIVPLFITSRHFKSRVRFIIVDYKPKFVTKFRQIISHLSDYGEIIKPTTNHSTSVHCFPGVVIGLHFHAYLAINSTDTPIGYSMPDFKHFLREAYNLKIQTVSEIEKPVLILISRRTSRTFLNENEIVGMMEKLGFRVIVSKPDKMSNFRDFSQVVNSCSVMVGIHGAGLTNELFLPTGAVMVQVVPLGLDMPSRVYFGEPAKVTGVQYLEYKIKPEESSLYRLYGKDHPIVINPLFMFFKMGYKFVRDVYIDGQHVKIDLERFRATLVEALRLLGNIPLN